MTTALAVLALPTGFALGITYTLWTIARNWKTELDDLEPKKEPHGHDH